MTDEKKPPTSGPLSTPSYRPRRGFLLEQEVKRRTKKSPFLKKLERARNEVEFTEADLRIIGEHQTPAPASAKVIHLDSRRKR